MHAQVTQMSLSENIIIFAVSQLYLQTFSCTYQRFSAGPSRLPLKLGRLLLQVPLPLELYYELDEELT